ncbi:MAG: helix-hairpin-helix domain-containing protein [Chloroflexota bacterium]|nr:helix-hairpin-helix domain-containing protein [Chloroflexota bacterium]
MSSASDATGPLSPALWEKLHACGIRRLGALASLTEEDLLSTCQLTAQELATLRGQMAREAILFRSGAIRYPFVSPIILQELLEAGLDLSQTGITSVGLPAWAERPLLAGGITTLGQLAASSTFYVRTALGLGGRTQSLLRQQVEEHLLRLLRTARHPQGEQWPGGDAMLRDLRLSQRTLGVLRRAGIFTIDQLRRMSDAELVELRGLGPSRLAELRAAIPPDIGQPPSPEPEIAVQAEALSVRPDVACRSVRELHLPEPLLQRLESADIRTVGDLITGGEDRLRGVPRIGKASVSRICSELERYLLGTLEEVAPSAAEAVTEVHADAPVATLDERLSNLLACLPSERLSNLVRWRYGLDGRIRTLQEVGAELGLSRERVRQLESLALARIRRQHADEVKSLARGPREALAAVGGVAPFSYMLDQLPLLFPIEKLDVLGAARLLLDLSDDCQHLPGRRCALQGAPVREVEQIDDALVTYLRKRVEPVSVPELIAEIAKSTAYPRVIEEYPSFSLPARVRANPLTYVLPSGLVALKEWTRSRLDDSIQALRELGKPSHYRTVAKVVQERLRGEVSVSVDAIHNLMLNEAAFVRVGRGVFALAEWQDAEPDAVRAIVNILHASDQPVHRGELARALGLPERVVERCLITRPEFSPAGRGYYKLAGQDYARSATSRRRRTTEMLEPCGKHPGARCARVLITPATLRSGALALNAPLRTLFPVEGNLPVAWPASERANAPHRLHRGDGHISGLGSFLRSEGVLAGDHVYIEHRPDEEPAYALYTDAQWRATVSTKTDSPDSAKPSDG